MEVGALQPVDQDHGGRQGEHGLGCAAAEHGGDEDALGVLKSGIKQKVQELIPGRKAGDE